MSWRGASLLALALCAGAAGGVFLWGRWQAGGVDAVEDLIVMWNRPAGLLLIAVIVLLVLWVIPRWQIAASSIALPKDRFAAEQEARKTLAQLIGGALVLATLYQTSQNIRVSQESLRVSQESLRTTYEGQITNRFSQAIDQLAGKDTKAEAPSGDPGRAAFASAGGTGQEAFAATSITRLGGIYGLERVAKVSDQDYWQALDVLTAFVRVYAAWVEPTQQAGAAEPSAAAPEVVPWWCVDQPRGRSRTEVPRPSPEVQAILDVLGRRDERLANDQEDARWFDLASTDLRGACLVHANLMALSFSNAHLERTFLYGAKLRKADLDRVHLEGAGLFGADLSGAYLVGAHLESAYLNGNLSGPTNLTNANLRGAQLQGARLNRIYARDLHPGLPPDVWLEPPNFEGAYLADARLDGANLSGADLSRTSGLTPEQISSAITDASTRLPEHIAAGVRRATPEPTSEPTPETTPESAPEGGS